MTTNKFSANNKVVACRVCGKQTHSSIDGDMDIELCRKCYDEANLENAHSDGHHDAAPVPNCPDCTQAIQKQMLERYLINEVCDFTGKKIVRILAFAGPYNEDFAGYENACAQLKQEGYHAGSMERHRPIGLVKGPAYVSKWTNMTESEHGELDAIMLPFPDFRHGGALVLFFDQPTTTNQEVSMTTKANAPKKAKAPKVPKATKIPERMAHTREEAPADATPCKQTGFLIKSALKVNNLKAEAAAKALKISVGYLRCLMSGRPVHLSPPLTARIREELRIDTLSKEMVEQHNAQAKAWYGAYRAKKKAEAQAVAMPKMLDNMEAQIENDLNGRPTNSGAAAVDDGRKQS